MRAVVLLLCLAAAYAVSVSVLDAPGLLERPGAPHPDEDGISVEDVVNVHKRVIVVVLSEASHADKRAIIRDNWVQALNRSSEYALPKEDRTSISVWFAVPTVKADDGLMASIREEGKQTGDMLILESQSYETPDSFTNLGALLRWLRVAYYQRYDLVLFTTDDSFVSLYSLLDFAKENGGNPFLYKGYLNSFEPNQEPNTLQKYYAPFVEAGTIVMGYQTAELVARELSFIRHLRRYDATLGNFLMTFNPVMAEHDARFIVNTKHVYSEIASPIVVKGVTPEMMAHLSHPICNENGCSTPPLPATTAELRSTYVYVNPIPKEDDPLCNDVNNVKCSVKALTAMTEP